MSKIKAKVRKEMFESAINKVSCALGDKTDDDITKYISIEVTDDSMNFICHRDDICAKYTIPIGEDLEIKSNGKVVIEGLPLINNVSKYHDGVDLILESEEIEIEKEDEEKETSFKELVTKLNIEYKTKHGKLWKHTHQGISDKYFAEIDFDFDVDRTIEYDGKKFINNINKVAFAAMVDNYHEKYTVMTIDPEPEGLTMIASDGRQLAYLRDTEKTFTESQNSILIESRILMKIARDKIFDEFNEVLLHVCDPDDDDDEFSGKVKFVQENLSIINNLINVERLSYEKIIEMDQSECKFEIDATSLKEDLKALSPSESKETLWKFKEDSIEVENVGYQSKKTTGEISSVENFEGDECSVNFHIKYWEDILTKCNKDNKIKVNVRSSSLPVELTISEEPIEYKYFIMPIIKK